MYRIITLHEVLQQAKQISSTTQRHIEEEKNYKHIHGKDIHFRQYGGPATLKELPTPKETDVEKKKKVIIKKNFFIAGFPGSEISKEMK